MTNFTKFKSEDFLANESFTNYLLKKNDVDIKFWEDWINENPLSEYELKKAKQLFHAIKNDDGIFSVANPSREEIENEYAKIKLLLNGQNSAPEAKVITLTKNAGRFGFNKMVRKIAAIAAVLVISFSLWYFFHPANSTKKTEFIALAKTHGTHQQITLPDGTELQLNNNSSVEISKDYNREKREVLLKGSAFFKVHKDQSKPFIVTTGDVRTTALGTAFYIYNLHPKSMSVSLLEGKVRVEGNENYVELLPGEKAFINENHRIYKDAFNKEQLLSFTNGKIRFEHANLQEIKTILQEYFNKEVLIQGDAPKVNFTGSFDSKKLETILEALQFTYNLTYKSDGEELTINFNQAKPE